MKNNLCSYRTYYAWVCIINISIYPICSSIHNRLNVGDTCEVSCLLSRTPTRSILQSAGTHTQVVTGTWPILFLPVVQWVLNRFPGRCHTRIRPSGRLIWKQNSSLQWIRWQCAILRPIPSVSVKNVKNNPISCMGVDVCVSNKFYHWKLTITCSDTYPFITHFNTVCVNNPLMDGG